MACGASHCPIFSRTWSGQAKTSSIASRSWLKRQIADNLMLAG
jgi:hypothetical protein